MRPPRRHRRRRRHRGRLRRRRSGPMARGRLAFARRRGLRRGHQMRFERLFDEVLGIETGNVAKEIIVAHQHERAVETRPHHRGGPGRPHRIGDQAGLEAAPDSTLPDPENLVAQVHHALEMADLGRAAEPLASCSKAADCWLRKISRESRRWSRYAPATARTRRAAQARATGSRGSASATAQPARRRGSDTNRHARRNRGR